MAVACNFADVHSVSVRTGKEEERGRKEDNDEYV